VSRLRDTTGGTPVLRRQLIHRPAPAILSRMARPDPSKEILLEILDCAFDKRSWHGPNLMNSLRGVNAKLASRRIPSRKTIWQQTLHAAYWKQRVLNALTTSQRFPRPGVNWPKPPAKPTDAAWRTDVELLQDIQKRLRAALLSCPAEKLNAKMRWVIQGAAAHDLYHAGQINLLRRLVRGK